MCCGQRTKGNWNCISFQTSQVKWDYCSWLQQNQSRECQEEQNWNTLVLRQSFNSCPETSPAAKAIKKILRKHHLASHCVSAHLSKYPCGDQAVPNLVSMTCLIRSEGLFYIGRNWGCICGWLWGNYGEGFLRGAHLKMCLKQQEQSWARSEFLQVLLATFARLVLAAQHINKPAAAPNGWLQNRWQNLPRSSEVLLYHWY